MSDAVSQEQKTGPGSVQEHREQAPSRLGFGVVTASSSRTSEDDTSGDLIRERVRGAGHRVVESRVVPDDTVEIRGAVEGLLARDEVDAVVVTGGTGFSPWDVTVEAVSPLFERELAGFGELFRMLSWEQVGSAAMLSRATAGVSRRRAIFLLPGSPKAVDLAMERLILPEAAHLVGLIRKR
jgi:molybdenum cofactor biosynthesis protein B